MTSDDKAKSRWRTSVEVQIRSRQLRAEQTPMEAKLWSYLRNRQLDGLKFRRQHPIGRFIVDFCCVENHLIVEIDGPVHYDQVEQDQARTMALEAAGYAIIRFTNEQIAEQINTVLADLRQALMSNARHTTSPSPAAAAEGARG